MLLAWTDHIPLKECCQQDSGFAHGFEVPDNTDPYYTGAIDITATTTERLMSPAQPCLPGAGQY